jgi:hypothetical protein
MAGLDPAIHALSKQVIEIVPFWILTMNELHLPSPRPMLEVLLSLNSTSYVLVKFGIDEPL